MERDGERRAFPRRRNMSPSPLSLSALVALIPGSAFSVGGDGDLSALVLPQAASFLLPMEISR